MNRSRVECVRALLHGGASVNVRDAHGCSPLSCSVADVKVLEALLGTRERIQWTALVLSRSVCLFYSIGSLGRNA